MTQRVDVTVNGVRHSADVEDRLTLADFLREGLRLTGTHLGCEHGVCGACTVLMEGEAVRSCLIFAVQADGAEVVTVEGLAEGRRLSPLQEQFQRAQALQCGFCTPGLLMTAAELLGQPEQPTDEEIRDAVSGHICRCTGYVAVIDAIKAAAGMGGPRADEGEASEPVREG